MARGFWVYIKQDDEDKNGCVAILAIPGLILLAITKAQSFLSKWVCEWPDYSTPFMLLSAYYYYTLYVPVSWICSPWEYIYTRPLTSYPFLNMALASLLILILGSVAIFSLRWLIIKLRGLGLSPIKTYIFTPWVLLVLWFIFEILFWQPEQIDPSSKASSEDAQAVYTNVSGVVEVPDSEVFPAPVEVTVDTPSNTNGISDLNTENGGVTNLPEKVEKKGFFRRLKNIVF